MSVQSVKFSLHQKNYEKTFNNNYNTNHNHNIHDYLSSRNR